MQYSHILKKHIEKLYNGICTIIYYENEKGLTNNTIEFTKYENIPCRLSYERAKQGEQTETTTDISQIIKLFLPPDIEANEGCKIIVTQEGETNTFLCAGKSALYGSHREIVLKLEKEYA
ncbi:hypothetical protein AAK894_13090 [Lachnospiraceae bacterium 46-61]